MDGNQTTEEMRRNAAFRRLPIVALTAMKGDRENLPQGQTLSPNRSLSSSFYPTCAFGAPLGGPNVSQKDPVNILLVDDQPAKLLTGSASNSTGSNARTGWCRCSTRCKTWRALGSWP